MVNERTTFGGRMTEIGEAKRMQMLAKGRPWKIYEMAIGDANGTDPVPSNTQRELIHECYRSWLNQLYIDPNNPQVLIAELVVPSKVGGWWIRELALIDTDGDLVAVANCPPSFKPMLAQGSGRTQTIRMHLLFPSIANVHLIDDPNVILVTRRQLEAYAVWQGAPLRGVPGTYVIQAGWKIPYGSLRCPISPTLLSRKAYGALFKAITRNTSVDMEPGSKRLRVMDTPRDIEIGYEVGGIGIQPGTKIEMIDGSDLFIDRPATERRSNLVTVAPWGCGDGKTTFGMPWCPENIPLVQANNLVASLTPGAVMHHDHAVNINSSGQSQGHSHTVIEPGHAHIMPGNSGMGNSGGGDTINQNASPRNAYTNPAVTGISLAQNNVDHFHNVRGTTAATGGPANLPAGMRARLCVWY